MTGCAPQLSLNTRLKLCTRKWLLRVSMFLSWSFFLGLRWRPSASGVPIFCHCSWLWYASRQVPGPHATWEEVEGIRESGLTRRMLLWQWEAWDSISVNCRSGGSKWTGRRRRVRKRLAGQLFCMLLWPHRDSHNRLTNLLSRITVLMMLSTTFSLLFRLREMWEMTDTTVVMCARRCWRERWVVCERRGERKLVF